MATHQAIKEQFSRVREQLFRIAEQDPDAIPQALFLSFTWLEKLVMKALQPEENARNSRMK